MPYSQLYKHNLERVTGDRKLKQILQYKLTECLDQEKPWKWWNEDAKSEQTSVTLL
jgi:hypothetical protein